MECKRIQQVLESSRKRGLSLLVSDSNTEQLAARLLQSKAHRSLLEEMKQEAERMLPEADPELTYALFRLYGETGERITYERVYFERRKRLNAFAVMTLLEPEHNRYRTALHNTLWSICNEYTWCLPAHVNNQSDRPDIDLFSAETGFTLSEVLILLGDQLPVLLQKRMRDEVERRLFRPFLEQGPYGWEQADHNWAAVCAGSIGAAALHLIDDSVRLSELLERVLKALDHYLGGFGDDGACAEGYMYWQYGFGYYVYFAQLLKAATDGELSLFDSVKVKEIALFQQKCFTGGNSVVNFSDSLPQSGIFMGLSSYLHEEYKEVVIPDASLRAAYTADHCGRWAPAIRNLLWMKSPVSASDEGRPIWPAESHYLPDVQWLLSRYLSDEGGIYGFAAKGGHNDEPHNHNDVGHFIVHADGEAYLGDLGSGMYTAQYFGPERYALWCNGSQGHSVPILEGKHQQNGSLRRAAVKQASVNERQDQFVLDISEAYGNGAVSQLERSFLWRKEGLPSLTLTDSIVLASQSAEAAEGAVIERFITFLVPQETTAGRILLQGKRQLSIFYDYLSWEPVMTERKDIDHFGQERLWYTLDFRCKLVDRTPISAHFVFQFDS